MNRTYRSIWNEALGAWVAASEIDSARGKPNKSAVVVAAVAALAISLPGLAEANTLNTQQTCFTGSNGAVGRINPGGTQNQAGDGSGTYSVVAGCNSNGNGWTGVTVYGSFAQATGNGAVATGMQSSAGLWGVAAGLETTASGAGATALGFGSTANALNSVAIGGAGGNGTTPLSQANSTIASGAGAVAIGSNATKGAQSAASDGIAIGGQSSVASTATSGIAVGRGATVNGAYGIAQGDGAVAGVAGNTSITNNVAVGAAASSTGANAIALGGSAKASGANSMATGFNASATGATSYAGGFGAVASNTDATAIGNQATASGAQDTAIGVTAIATGGTGSRSATRRPQRPVMQPPLARQPARRPDKHRHLASARMQAARTQRRWVSELSRRISRRWLPAISRPPQVPPLWHWEVLQQRGRIRRLQSATPRAFRRRPVWVRLRLVTVQRSSPGSAPLRSAVNRPRAVTARWRSAIRTLRTARAP